jgi:hypothetical protein
MHTDRQVFLDHDATGRTPLRRAAWINLQTHRTGTFRLVLCVADQLIPSCVGNALCQRVILDHPVDTQVLKDDDAKLVDQTTAQLVRKVLPSIADPFVDTPNNTLAVLSFRRAFGFFRQTALCSSKGLLIGTKEARIGDLLTRRKGGKLFQSNINPDSGTGVGDRLGVSEIAGHEQIPVISAARERKGFDRSFDWTVQHDADLPNMLEVHVGPVDLASIAVGRKLHRVKALPAFEPWIPSFVASLYTAKEGLECFVQSAQGGLATRKVGLSKKRVSGAFNLQLCRLSAVAHSPLILFPGIAPFRKGTIVQMPMRIKHLAHRAFLLARGIEAVSKCFAHNLAPCLLLLDIAPDCRIADGSCGPNVVGPGPQCWQLRTQVWKLLPKQTRGVAFELVGKKLRRVGWLAGNNEMDVFRHHFQAFDLDLQGGCFFVEQFFQSLFNRANEHLLAILRAPHKMQVQVENTSGVLPVSLRTHVVEYSTMLYICQLYNMKGGRAIPSPAIAGGSMAYFLWHPVC